MIFAQISDQTTLSVGIGLAGVIASSIAVGSWKIFQIMSRIDAKFERIERKYQETWAIGHMRTWARQLDQKNKELFVPDPDSIKNADSKHGASNPPY